MDGEQPWVGTPNNASWPRPDALHPAAARPGGADTITQRGTMNQSAWLNVAVCAAQRSKNARQEANNFKPESSKRRLLVNREIDEWSTVNMAFNRAAGTRVLLASGTFPWMFDYSELNQSVVEEAP
jgi:hypothetical protein